MATVEDIEESKKGTRPNLKSSFMIEDILSNQAKAAISQLNCKFYIGYFHFQSLWVSFGSKYFIRANFDPLLKYISALNAEQTAFQSQFQQNLAAINMLSRTPRVPLITPSLHSLAPGNISIVSGQINQIHPTQIGNRFECVFWVTLNLRLFIRIVTLWNPSICNEPTLEDDIGSSNTEMSSI